MRVIPVVNAPFDSYCYIVTKDDKNCLIIDLGGDFSVIDGVLKAENLTPLAVLLTHSHFDHVCGIKSARDKGVQVYISQNDAKNLESANGTLSTFVGVNYAPVFDYQLLDEKTYLFGDILVEVIYTPGHTSGSVVYKIDDLLFSGDTVFKGTVGRTDLPSGSYFDIKKSVNRLIARLLNGNTNYKIYPGHGDFTDFYTELKSNPYFLEWKNA